MNEELLNLIYIIVGSQALFNGFVIVMWAYAQHNLGRRKEEVSTLETRIAELQHQIVTMNTTMNAAINQATRLVEVFLKPDPRLHEYFVRKMEEEKDSEK